MKQPSFGDQKISVGISDCLLGAEVRYNGGHKRSTLCTDHLSHWFDFRPFCPEVAIGLGVPRPTLRLIASDQGEITIANGVDGNNVAPQLTAYGLAVASANTDLSGFIFTTKSPSCGVFRVKVYLPNGNLRHEAGSGAFAQAILAANPLLPVEESGRLGDARLRENFVMRVFAYHQWQQLCRDGLTRGELIAFYSRYKYLMLAHHPLHYRLIGRLLAAIGLHPLASIAEQFIALFMQGLAKPASPRRIGNALEHMRGYARRWMSDDEKNELSELIDSYRRGHLPLIAVLVMMRHHIQRSGDNYAQQQVFLRPIPDQLLSA